MPPHKQRFWVFITTEKSNVKGIQSWRKCVSYCLHCAESHNYNWCPTKPMPHHVSGLNTLPKVFCRWNSYQGLVTASFSDVNLTRSPYSSREKSYLDEPAQGWQVLLRDVTVNPHYYLLGFPCFPDLHSSTLLVSQQSYGETILRNLCLHETHNLIGETYTNNGL